MGSGELGWYDYYNWRIAIVGESGIYERHNYSGS